MSVPQASLDLLIDRLGHETGPENPLDRFVVKRLLGSGRFALVAEADDPDLKRRVALKLPLPEFLADARFRARLIREAQLAARLDHPGIVPIHEVIQAGPEVTFLVLGLVEGPTLDRWMETQAPVPPEVACRLVAAIADAVQHAHDRKVLHLDLKPSNILLDLENELVPGVGSPRVADFGLARATDGARPKTTAVMAGTPGYMAPEQLNGPRGRLTEQSDIWALGVILYQLLTGRLPFDGVDFAFALAGMKSPPAAPSRLRPGLSRSLDEICATCLRPEPKGRYGRAALLAADLRAAADGRKPAHVARRRRVRPVTAAESTIAVAIGLTLLLGLWDRRPKLPTGPQFTNSLGMEFVRIEPGEFMMGSPPNEPERMDGEDQRLVRIDRPYYLGRFEVTFGQYEKFVQETGYLTDAESGRRNSVGFGGTGYDAVNKTMKLGVEFNWRSTGYAQSAQHPVGNLSWFDAAAFCKWLSVREGMRYSLPTEAEWEYACRAGSPTAFSFGDDRQYLWRYARYRTDRSWTGVFFPLVLIDRDPVHPLPDPVGQHQPNAWGLYDMHGNVREWCLDGYDSPADWVAGRNPIRDPNAPRLLCTLRGGSWGTPAAGCRSAHRLIYSASDRGANIGFRVSCEAAPLER